MIGSFSNIKAYFKLETIKTDNRIFRLHCQLTVGFLLGCAIIVSFQYFGTPINCTVNSVFDDAYGSVMNTYCWIMSTYTIPNLITSDGSAAYPGVGPKLESKITNVNNRTILHDDTIKYHAYYQWVVFFLLFQALLFYLPKIVWTLWENGRLAMLINDLNVELPLKKEYESSKASWERNASLKYFLKSINQNNSYLHIFTICEILNFINIIGQIFLTNRFLGYEFTTYGTAVLDFMDTKPSDRNDPMNIIFPKMTKCTFNVYGASGNIINHDGLCVLQLNIYNEKIYVFLWFWFIILAIISGLGLIYRLLTYVSIPIRVVCLKRRSFTSSLGDIKRLTRILPIGDWFLLIQLSQNMNGLMYHQFIEDLSESMKRT